MHGRLLAFLCLVSLLTVNGVAQGPPDRDNSVWTVELIKVKPGQFDATLGYLDNNWVYPREQAKRAGDVLNYYRIAERGNSDDERTISLLTEYKDEATCDRRESLYASILRQRLGNPPRKVRLPQHQDLYELVSTQVFEDYSSPHVARLRPLIKQ